MERMPVVGEVVHLKMPVRGVSSLEHEVLPFLITHVHSRTQVSRFVFSAHHRGNDLHDPISVQGTRDFGNKVHQWSWPPV